jgi:hypothetical protein
MMEPTVTQNNALYFVQHKGLRQRAGLFRRFTFPFRKKRRGVLMRRSSELFLWPSLHQGKKR